MKNFLTINGKVIEVAQDISILQALADAQINFVKNVGCTSGVCGSCKVLIKVAGEEGVKTALACETIIQSDMTVVFIENKSFANYHKYATLNLQDVDIIFPEAKNCRHCGCCSKSCPKKIKVEETVNSIVLGDFSATENFDECIMCDLCSLACPENITPNHLIMYVHRAKVATSLLPIDLTDRLNELKNNEQVIKFHKENHD